MAAWRPDVVHAHEHHDPRLLALAHGFPRVTTVHDPVPHPGHLVPNRVERGVHRRLVSGSDAVVVHANGKVLFTNPAACELLGIDAEQTLVGRDLAEFVHPDSRDAFAEETVEHATSPDRTPRARAKMLSTGGGIVDVEALVMAATLGDQESPAPRPTGAARRAGGTPSFTLFALMSDPRRRRLLSSLTCSC